MRRIMLPFVAVIVFLWSPLVIAAQEASPAAAECVAPALPPGTPTPMEELMPEATPAHDMEGMEMASPPAEAGPADDTSSASGPLAGEPANAETTDRVIAAAENLVACLNAGDGLAFAALVTPGYLEYSFGITNPYDMVYVMEGFPSVSLLSVDNVLVHDDGRVSVEIVQQFAETQVDRFQAVFIDEGGQLLLDEEITLPVEGADVTIDVTMLDFSFEMSGTTVPTDAMVAFNVTNDGEYPHEFAVMRLPEGVTVDQMLEDPEAGESVEFIGGVFAEPGDSASFALQNLEPGTYTVVCFVDVPEGVPHVMRGMVAELTVE